MRSALATIDGAADRAIAVVVEHQVRMSTRSAQPALDSILRRGDRSAHSTLGGRTVGISRRARNARLALQSLAQLVVSLSHVLAQDVPARSLVLAEVAGWTVGRVRLSTRNNSTPAISVGGSARDQAAQPHSEDAQREKDGNT